MFNFLMYFELTTDPTLIQGTSLSVFKWVQGWGALEATQIIYKKTSSNPSISPLLVKVKWNLSA